MFVGCDGGVFRTQNQGLTFASMNKNFNVTQFYSVATRYDGTAMGGCQDNGTQFITFNGNDSMAAAHVTGGDGGAAAFSTIHSKALFTSIYNGDINRSSDNGANFNSGVDMFNSRWATTSTTTPFNFNASFVTPMVLWESISDANSTDSIKYKPLHPVAAGTSLIMKSNIISYPFSYTTPIHMDSTVEYTIQDPIQSKLFLGITGGVLMTKRALDFSKIPYWIQISKFTSGDVQAMAFSRNGDILYVGTQDGKLFRISHISQAVDSLNADYTSSSCVIVTDQLGSYGRPISSITVDPNDANRVLFTLCGYGSYTAWIYLSENATAPSPTFTLKQGNLPNIPVYASLIVLDHPNQVILGTEYGIFTTDNITAANPVWTIENTGQLNQKVPVFMITQQINNFPFKTVTTIDPSGNPITATFPGTTNYGTIYIGTHGRGIFACKKYYDGVSDYQTLSDDLPTIKVYPNPVSNFTNINYDVKQAGTVTFNVYDLRGRLVKTQVLSQQPKGSCKLTLDCSSFENGTYLVQAINGNNRVSGKFIVNK